MQSGRVGLLLGRIHIAVGSELDLLYAIKSGC